MNVVALPVGSGFSIGRLLKLNNVSLALLPY